MLPVDTERLSLERGVAFAGWLPWALLSAVMVVWSYLKLFKRGQLAIPVPCLHNAILITLYQKPYAALYSFQPLAAGTAALVATVFTALIIRAKPRVFLNPAGKHFGSCACPGSP